MSMLYRSKYLGALKNYDFGENLLDDNNFQVLLENNIIIDINEIDNSEANLKWLIPFNDKFYTIDRNFLEDIYEMISLYVQELPNDKVFWYVDKRIVNYSYFDVKNLIEVTLDKYEKISILKNIYKQINLDCLNFNLCEIDKPTFEHLQFVNPRDNDDFPISRMFNFFLSFDEISEKKWKEWVYERFSSKQFFKRYLCFDDSLLFSEKYLFQAIAHESQYQNYDLILIWSNFITLKKINNYCNLKVSELEKEINSGKNSLPPNTQGKTLKSILEKEELYEIIMKNLMEKKIIEISCNGRYKIIIPKKFHKRGAQFYICSIGMQLFNKGYIQKDFDNQAISEALNNTFENSSVSRQNYDYLKDSPNIESYLSYTSFIPRNIV